MCNLVKIPMECEVKLSRDEEEEKMVLTEYKNLVGSMHYLTCTRLGILFRVGLDY